MKWLPVLPPPQQPTSVNASSPQKRVVVIGGGVTGLAAAHAIVERGEDVEVVLLEASDRLGGVLRTVELDGFLVEQSADNFITNVPWAVDLCQRVGLGDELIRTSTEQRGALVVRQGKLARVPAGFMLLAPSRLWPLVTTPILSPWGKLRLLAERFVPRRRETTDESLASFARRRLGREAFERIVQPLVGGIYAADPERLSLQATLPRFIDMEREHGSLIRAARRSSDGASENSSPTTSSRDEAGARYSLFATPKRGLTSLVDAVASRLPSEAIRLNTSVERITQDAGQWTVQITNPAGMSTIACDAVIVAASAQQAARMLRQLDPALSNELTGIPSAGTSIVSLAYRRDQIENAMEGFGFVVPAIENRRILAASFSSVKFAGRAPDGMVLVRVFVGGACQSDLANLPDEALRQLASEELKSLLAIRGEPLWADIARWPGSMPQYHVGHGERVAAIERSAARWPGLALAGNAYHGVGIPHCIHSGQSAAKHVLEQLNR